MRAYLGGRTHVLTHIKPIGSVIRKNAARSLARNAQSQTARTVLATRITCSGVSRKPPTQNVGDRLMLNGELTCLPFWIGCQDSSHSLQLYLILLAQLTVSPNKRPLDVRECVQFKLISLHRTLIIFCVIQHAYYSINCIAEPTLSGGSTALEPARR